MRNFAYIAMVLILLIASFGSGFLYEKYEVRPTETKYGCAHYDAMTGDFTWGPSPISVSYPPDPTTKKQPTTVNIIAPAHTKSAPRPGEKPPVPYSRNNSDYVIPTNPIANDISKESN